ncbi:MAG: extracellular solute-binding protein [Deltaproteobacteria bacterium]|nr:extracellular solute-binding protein [Deltaproteobacteria bacterium]
MSKKLSAFISLLFGVLVISTGADAQNAKLIEAAKKEGKIVAYGSLESDTMDSIMQSFHKKFGIEVEYFRASATKVMDRAMSEFRAGKPLADVIVTADNVMRLMQKDGFFQKYDSPTNSDFPKDVIDPLLGPRYRNVVIGVVYNKSGLKPTEYPKSLDDLAKPQYKGKIVMPDPTQHTTTTQWLASLYKIMGKEKSEKFMRDLAANKPAWVESLLPAAERVASGEFPVAITYVKYAYIHGKQGAPVDYVRDAKLIGDASYITLGSKAPHVNAGKAFIDYFLDDESMNTMSKLGEFVNRKGILPPLAGADKLGFVEMDDLSTKEFADKKKEYEKIFLR